MSGETTRPKPAPKPLGRRQARRQALFLLYQWDLTGQPLASLFEDADAPPAAEPSPLARVADQPVWTDPASGYVRRNVSPPARSTEARL